MQKYSSIKASLKDLPDSIVIAAEELTIAAAAGESEGDRARRMDIRAYNGGFLRVEKYPYPVVCDIKGMRVRRTKLPVDREHDPDRLVGHIHTIDKSSGEYINAVAFASVPGADREQMLAAYDNDYPWEASIEVRPTSPPKLIPEGKTIQVNGREHTGPFILAKTSELYRISIVGQGGDDEGATVRIAASAQTQNHDSGGLPMDFTEWLKKMHLDPETLTDQQTAALKAKFDAEVKDGPPPIKGKAGNGDSDPPIVKEIPEFDPVEIQAAYTHHVAVIEAEAAGYDSSKVEKLAEIKAKALEGSLATYRQAVSEKWPTIKLEAETIKAQADFRVELVRAERPTAPPIHSSSKDLKADVLEAALSISAGLPDYEKAYSDKTLEEADKHYRSLGLQEAMLICARANGYSGRGSFRSGLREIFEYAFPIRGAFTAVSLPGVLGAAANKFILAGFNHVDDTWRQISAVKPATDFKAMTRYRLTDGLEYEEVGASGEIKHGSLGEENYTNQAKTYAKMLGLTRVNIINDDLGAFDTIRQRLGRGAALKLNTVFWTAFLDNASFFTDARGNYMEGAGTTLQSSQLTAAVLLFRKLKTPAVQGQEGHVLGVKPKNLLVPPELEVTADELYESTNMVGGSTKSTAKNTHAGKYKPIVTPYLSDDSITNYSTTGWYLLGDKDDLPVMEVVFLNNQQTPIVESAEANFNVLGVEFRGYHDFGAAKAEYNGGVKSKGAA